MEDKVEAGRRELLPWSWGQWASGGKGPLMWPHFIFQVSDVRKKFAPNPSAIFQASAPRILNV